MSSRFITGALSVVLAGFVVVMSQVFRPDLLSQEAILIAIGVLVMVLLCQLDPSRGALQRVLDACSVVVSGLMIGFALAASGTTVTWLSFAFALGLVGIGFVGRGLNEVAKLAVPAPARRVPRSAYRTDAR
jgi:multisubunit Na+/H+ antiporter MnhB subunit